MMKCYPSQLLSHIFNYLGCRSIAILLLLFPITSKRSLGTFYKIVAFVAFLLFSLAGYGQSTTIKDISPNPLVLNTPATITASNASGDFFIYDPNGNLVASTTKSATVNFIPTVAGKYTIEYRKNGGNSAILAQTTATTGTVTSLISISFNPSQSTFCLNDPSYTISGATGSPAGGTMTYSGAGVSLSGSNYIFTPTTAGSGTFPITATYTSGSNFVTATADFTVNSAPATQTLYATPSTTYCDGTSGTTLNLSGSETGVTYTLYRNGFSTGKTGTSWSSITDGTYTAVATNTTTGCTQPMKGTVAVTKASRPTATISGGKTICAGTSTPLTINLTGTAPWTITYTANGTTATPITTYSNSATIYVSPNTTTVYQISALSDNNCTASAGDITGSTTVVVNPKPTATISGGTTLCKGQSTTLQVNFTGSAPWNFTYNDETSNTNVTNITTNPYTFTLTPTKTATYTLISVNDANSCTGTVSGSAYVKVNDLPAVNAGIDKTICSGTSYTLLATGAATYVWDNGPATSDYTVAPTTTTNYTVTGTSANGCKNTDDVKITVNPLPSANAGTDIEICKGASTTLTASGGTSYYWNTTGANTASILVSPLTTTNYLVTVSNTFGCSTQATVKVTVNENPTVDAGIDLFMCHGDSRMLTANAAGGTPGYTYLWSNGQKFQSVTVNPTNTTILPVVYTYTVTATDSKKCTATDAMIVTVNPLPVVSINNLEDSYCADQGDVLITGIPTGNTGHFSINAGTLNDHGDGTATFTPSAQNKGTNYTITYTYTDGNGCSNSVSRVVYVRNETSPTPTISGLDPIYCDDNTSTITAIGTPKPNKPDHTGIFTGIASDNGDGTASFIPKNIAVGDYTITYTYTDYYHLPVEGSCSNSASQAITIGVPVKINVKPDYCVGDKSFTLTVTKPNSTNTGTFIVENAAKTYSYTAAEGSAIFDPTTLPAGKYTISYTTTSSAITCTGSATATVEIHALPDPTFTINYNSLNYLNSDKNIDLCENGGTALLKGYYYPSGAFSSPDPGVFGFVFDPAKAGVGFHTINYNYTNNYGCSINSSAQIEVLAVPKATITCDSIFCHDHVPVLMVGDPKKGNGTFGTWTAPTGWAPTIFKDNADGTATLDPTKVPTGIDHFAITYQVPQQSGCVSSATKNILVNYLPTPDFAGLPTEICENASTITLLGNPQDSKGTFSGNGITDNKNGTATFDPTGMGGTIQPITYSYTDTKGCSNSITKNTTVKPKPVLYNITGGGTYCANSNANHVGLENSEVGTFYQLYLNGTVKIGSTIKGDGKVIDFGLVTSAGTYTVMATGANSCSLQMNGSAAVVINPLPLAASVISGSNKVCPGGTYTFTTPTILNATSYKWTLPANATIKKDNGNSVDVLFDNSITPGIAVIKVKGSNSCGDGDEISYSFTVLPLPDAAGTITGPTSDKVCQGDNMITYSVAPITNATSYIWTSAVSGATIVSGQNGKDAVFNFSATAATGQITVAGVNACGTGTASTKTINVIPTPTVSADINSGAINCKTGSTVTLKATTSSDAVTSKYAWVPSNGGHIASGGTSATPIVDLAGTYTLTVTEPENSCKASASVIVTDDKTAPADVIITPSLLSQTISCINPDIDLTASTTSIFTVTYAWVASAGGNIVSGDNTATARVDKKGTYTVTITNTSNGCTTTKSIDIADNSTVPVITDGPAPAHLNCKISQVEISATSPNCTYLWSTVPSSASAGATFTGGDNIYNPQVDKPGLYNLTVTATNGCTATKQYTVLMDTDLPQSVSIDAPGTLTCTNKTVQLKGESTTTNASFSWAPAAINGGHIKDGTSTTNQLATVDGAGDFILTVTHPVSYCSVTASVTVSQNMIAPVITFPTGPADITCKAPLTSTITASVTPATSTFTYEWTGPLGSTIGTPAATSTTVNLAGTYQLKATDNTNGCFSINTISVAKTANPTVSIATPDEVTCAKPIVTLKGSTNITSYTAAWSGPTGGLTGSTTDINATVTKKGTYTLSITDNLTGCTGTYAVNVSENTTPPDITINPVTDKITCGNTKVTLSAISSTSNVSYQWTGPAGATITDDKTAAPSVDKDGTYTLVITDNNNGCTSTGTAIVNPDFNKPTIPQIKTPDKLTCSKTTTNLEVSPLLTNVDYKWTTTGSTKITNDANAIATVSATGDYTVTVTDRNSGCTNQNTVTVYMDDTKPSPAITGGPYQITCSSKSILLNGNTSVGINPVWSASNGGNIASNGNTLTPTVDATGTYTLTLTNATTGCNASTSVNVTPSVDLPNIYINAFPASITCANANKTVTLEGYAKETGMTTAWSVISGNIVSGGTSTVPPTVDQAGDYMITVINPVTGCSNKAVITVTANNTPPKISIDSPDKYICTTTSIALKANTPVTNATYAWTTSNGKLKIGTESDQVAYALLDGDYTVTVTNNDNSCTNTSTVTVVPDRTAPQISVDKNPSQITCTNTLVSISGSSTTSGVTYKWTGAGNIYNPTSSTAKVDASGTYTLTITNPTNGCTSSDVVNVSSSTTAPLVTIDPVTLVFSQTVKAIQLNASSNLTDVTYAWTGPGNISDPTSKTTNVDAPGTYKVTATGTNGCTGTASITIGSNYIVPTTPVTTDATICEGSPAATLTATGTNVKWYSNISLDPSTKIADGNNFTPSSYTTVGSYNFYVTQTDATSGNTSLAATVTYTIKGLPISPTAADKAVCQGTANPALTATGATGATIKWYDKTIGGTLLGTGNYTPPSTVSAPSVYYYYATQTDANGCESAAQEVTLTINKLLNLTVGTPDKLTCTNNQHVTLSGSADVTGAKLQWTGPAIESGSTGSNPVVTADGTYTLTATDPNTGCPATNPATIKVEKNTTSPTVQFPATPGKVTCSNPQVTITGTTSAVNPKWEWSTSDGTLTSDKTNSSVTVSSKGNYKLTVTDADNGCSNSNTISIDQNSDIPDAKIDPPATITCNKPNITLNGSSTSSPVSVTWTATNGGVIPTGSENSFTPTINKGGTYTMKVTNTSTGCTNTATVTVTDKSGDKPVISKNDSPDVLNCKTSSVKLYGTAPNCTLNWTGPTGATINDATSSTPTVYTAGIYTLTATDVVTGCQSTTTIEVKNTTATVTAPTIDSPVQLNCTNTAVTLTGHSTISGVLYSWSPSNGGNITSTTTESTATVNQKGDYTLTITDPANYCTASTTVHVDQNVNAPVITFPTAPSAITCSSTTSVLNSTVTTSSGTTPDLLWSGPGSITDKTTLTPTVNTGGTYTLTAIDTQNGCKASKTLTVAQNTVPPVFSITPPTLLNCSNETNGITVYGNTALTNYSAAWTTTDGTISGPTNQLSVTVKKKATYTLTITNKDNGCYASKDVAVDDDKTAPDIYVDPNPAKITCANTSTTLYGTSSSANASLKWTGTGIISSNIIDSPVVNLANTFTLTVTGSNGCTSTGTVTVKADTDKPDAPVISTPDILNCQTSSVKLNVANPLSNMNYQWTTTGTGIIKDSNTATATVTEAGNYMVTATNKSNGCISDAASTVVTKVTTAPDFTIDPGPYTITCSATTVTLNSTANANATDPQWSSSNGGHIKDGGSTQYPKVDASGTYTLTMTNPDTHCSAQKSINVSADNTDMPEINFTPYADKLTCDRITVTLSGGPKDAADPYVWTASPGHFSGDQTTTSPKVDQPGTYTLTVTSKTTGCQRIASVTVTQDIAVPVPSISVPDTFFCNTTEVQIKASTNATNASFSWSIGGTGTGTIKSGYENTANTIVESAGTYNLVIKNTDNGCSSASTPVKVEEKKTPPDAVTNKTPDQLTCTRSKVILSGSSTTSNVSYLWYTNISGAKIDNANTIHPTVYTTGEYIMQVTDNHTGCTNTDKVTVTPNTTTPQIWVNATPDSITCVRSLVQLNSSSTTANVKYTWSGPGNISQTNVRDPYVDLKGTYTLTVTDPVNGCTSTSDVVVIENKIHPAAPLANNTDNCIQSITSPLTATGTLLKWYDDPALTTFSKVGEGSSFMPSQTTAGTYAYYVTQTDSHNGCESNATSVAFTIKPKSASPAIPDPVEICFGQTTPTLSAQGTNVKWYDAPNGNLIGTGNSLSTGKTAVGTYLFYATQTDGSGCESNPVTVQLIIHPIPSAPTLDKTSASICNGEAVPSLTASGSSIKWYADNLLLAPISTGNSFTPNISLNGTYDYYATQTSVYGCESATAKAEIQINANPDLFEVTGGGEFCEGTGGVNVGLNGSSTGVTYQLLLNGAFSTAISKTGTGAALDFGKQINAGIYTVLATGTNTCSKTMNGGVSISVNPLPLTGGSIHGDGNVCQGSTVSFEADSIPYATYYEWSLPQGATIITGGNTRKISISFGANAISGTLSVKGKNNCGYGGISSAKAIVINLLPGDANGTITGPTQVCQGEKYILYQFPSITNATSYEWTIPAGAKIVSGEGTNQIAVDFTGNDVGGTFTIRGVNSCGKGSISSSFSVILKNKPYANAGYDQIVCSSTGTLAATAPETGATALWTTIVGPAAVTSVNAPDSKVMGLMMGENKLVWTVTKNGCSASDTVILKNKTVQVDAGPDQTLCSKTAQLDARTPLTGGVWSLLKGSAVFYNGDYDNPQAKVSGLSQGENKLIWTVSNGCISVDTIVLVCNKPVTPEAGTPVTTITDIAQLAANIPETGTTGTWTVLSGAGSFEDKHSAISKISGLNPGINLLIWTVSRSGCSLSDTVSVEYQYPENAEAGPDQAICKDNTILAGNEPVTGVGQWSIVRGSATFVDASLYNTKVYGLNYGRNVLKWIIRKGGSSIVSDTVVITNNSVTIANAGLVQTTCADTATLSAGKPIYGTGKWSVINGAGTFDDETNNTTKIRHLATGVNTLKWVITKENCYSESTVTITNNTPTTAYAGPDIKTCTDSVVLIPNTPTIGTGSWSVISGSAIVSGNTMTRLAKDSNILRWTITKGNCTSTDDVTIINHKPSKADAGVDKPICIDSITLGGNKPIVGTGKWTLQSGSASISDTTYWQPLVKNLALGDNIFRWTITYNECSNYDEVKINSGYIQAIAGKDQTLCNDKVELNANSAWPGKGTWSVVGNNSGATVVNLNSSNTQVINLEKGDNTLRWTIINGSCTSTDDVVITNNLPSTAYAGADAELCKNNTLLDANQPIVGKGKWEILSGAGIIKDTSLYNSRIDSLGLGDNILRWTVTNKGCISSDEVKITNNQPINVSAGKDQTICKDSTYLYANKPSIGTGQWEILTGSAHFANNKQFDTYVNTLAKGTNIFKWTVTSGQCSVTDTVQVVNNSPSIPMAGPDQTLCLDSVQLAGNNPTYGTGEWLLIQGSAIIKNRKDFATTVTNLGFGINRFRWQITNQNCAFYDDVTIVNNLPSKPYAGANQSVCADSTVLYANIPEVGKGSWSVIAGNGVIAHPDSNQTKINRLVFGTNAFRWTTSNQNCKLYSDIVVTDNLAEINAGVDQIVFTSTANLIGNNPSKGTGKWYLAAGNGSIQDPNNFSSVVTGLGAGKNTFKWTIDNNGCVASDLVNIMYYVMPIPDFIPSTTEGCPPLTVSFVNKSIGGSPYHWDLGDSHYSDETNIIHTYTKAGTYKVKMTATSATGGTVEKDTVITVHILPKASFDLAPTEVYAPDQKMQTHNFSESSTSWLWNFGDGNTSKEFTPSHAYTDSGFYTISLIVWTDHQCSDTMTINNAVHVIEKSKFKFPSAFTPNIYGSSDGRYNPRDYTNDVFYPTIINGGIKEYHLEIFNRWGLKLFRSDDINIGWDGYHKGKLAVEGVYIYQATGIYNNGKRFSVTGDVLLIRK